MNRESKTRILLAKLGLDCHDTGITTLSYLLREEGFEVIYMGLHNSADNIYKTAVQEGVDVIGLSFLSGQQLPQMKKLMGLKRKEDSFYVILGGIIPKADISELERMGVDKVFLPGTLYSDIIKFVRSITTD